MAISHGCGGRVEEHEGGAEGVRGCGRVRAVPPGLRSWGGTAQGRRWARAVASPAGERRADGWPAEEEDYMGTHRQHMRTADS
jgi:hypothetical protein